MATSPNPWTLGVPPRNACPADMLDLSGAHGALGCSPYAARRAAEAARAVGGAWPEALASLTAALSRKHSVHEDRVCLGAGARALLPAVLRVLADGGRVATGAPAAPLHRLAAVRAEVPMLDVPLGPSLGHDLDAWLDLLEKERPALALIGHPLNPGGGGFSRDEAERLVEAAGLAGTTVVVDESYADYAERPEFARWAPFLDEAPHLVIVRSFSSLQGLGGLPVAYGLSSPETAARLRDAMLGAEPGEVAARTAVSAVEDPSFDQAARERTGRSRFRLAQALREWEVPCEAGAAPWVTAAVGDSVDAARRLAARGLRVRDLGPWGFPGWIRVRAGSEDEVARFVKDAKTVLTRREPQRR